MNSWFPHDCTAFSDAKLLRVRARYGWEGYAFYFVTLEWMYQMADAIADRSDIGSLSLVLGIDEEKTYAFVDYCIEVGLFAQDEQGRVSSPRLVSEKVKEHEKSSKAKEAAERRWGKINANALRPHCERICERNAPPTHHTNNIYADDERRQDDDPIATTTDQQGGDGMGSPDDATPRHKHRAEFAYLFSEYERIAGRKVLARKGRYGKLNSAIDVFGKENLRRAWAQMSVTPFLRGSNDKGEDYFTIDYALRHDKIEKYLHDFHSHHPDAA